MYKDKKVLLIGGGGTLGTYIAKELLRRKQYGLTTESSETFSVKMMIFGKKQALLQNKALKNLAFMVWVMLSIFPNRHI